VPGAQYQNSGRVPPLQSSVGHPRTGGPRARQGGLYLLAANAGSVILAAKPLAQHTVRTVSLFRSVWAVCCAMHRHGRCLHRDGVAMASNGSLLWLSCVPAGSALGAVPILLAAAVLSPRLSAPAFPSRDASAPSEIVNKGYMASATDARGWIVQPPA
jgi:hypothetical protein